MGRLWFSPETGPVYQQTLVPQGSSFFLTLLSRRLRIRFCLLFQGCNRFLNLGQAAFPSGQFHRQFVAHGIAVPCIFAAIRTFCVAHEFGDFLAQPLLLLFHPFVAHRFMLGSICFHLCTIERYMAQLHHSSILSNFHDLQE